MNRNDFNLEKLTGTLSHARDGITAEHQAILNECQQWLDNGGDKGAEMPEELWQKFWDAFGDEIEAKQRE